MNKNSTTAKHQTSGINNLSNRCCEEINFDRPYMSCLNKGQFVKILLIITILILALSCKEDRKSVKRMRVGNCFMEINKQFVSGTNFEQDTIYRIEGREEENIRLSTYQNRRWVFLGVKPVDSYQSGRNFEYLKVDCPDGPKSGAKLSDRVKKIDL